MQAMRPLLIIAALVTAHAFAAEPATPAATPQTAQPKPAAPPAGKAAAADKSAAQAKAADGKSEADKAADKTGEKDAAKGSPQRFIPSEQVRADFDVSFPVDI
jgi:hypothetical protein